MIFICLLSHTYISLPPEHTQISADSLKTRTRKAAFWQAASRITVISIQFIATIWLARLLTPEDFGVFAFGLTIVTFVQYIQFMGLGQALVQYKSIEKEHCDTVFWSVVTASVLLFTIIFFSADWLAVLFNQAAIGSFIRLLAVTLLISAFANVPLALLRRRLNFQFFFFVQAGGSAVYLFVAVMAAYRGYGYWSLAAGDISRGIVQALLGTIFSRYIAGFRFTTKAFRQLIGFGAGVAGADVVANIAMRVDQWIVARQIGFTELGLYNRAYTLMELPVGVIGWTLETVLFPVFSKMQDDRERVARTFGQALKVSAVLSAPLVFGLMVAAPEAVPVVLGDQWFGAIAPLQILCVAGLIRISTDLTHAPIRGLGASTPLFIAQIVRLVITIIVCWFAAQLGLVALSWGIVIVSVVFWASLVFIFYRLTGFGAVSYIAQTFAPLVAAGIAAGLGHLLRHFMALAGISAPLILAATLLLIAVAYAAIIQFTGIFTYADVRRISTM